MTTPGVDVKRHLFGVEWTEAWKRDERLTG